MDPQRFIKRHRSPPSCTDCRVLAFGQIRPAVVVTDDLALHELADIAEIGPLWQGPKLVKRMLSAKLIDIDLVREIYSALEATRDVTAFGIEAKHTTFSSIFGNPAPGRPTGG